MIGGEEYVTRSTGHSTSFAKATKMHNDEGKDESTDEVKWIDLKERGCWKEGFDIGYRLEDISNCSKRMHNDERRNERTDEVKVKDVKERGCWKEDIGRGYWKEDIGNCSKREV